MLLAKDTIKGLIVHSLYACSTVSISNVCYCSLPPQTLPLLQTLPPTDAIQKAYRKAYHLNLPNSTVVTVDLHRMKGSCCDSGRYTVTECGHWWYQCPDWGLKVSVLLCCLDVCGINFITYCHH